MNVELEEKNRIIRYLSEKGRNPRFDADGDLALSKDGVNFWILFDSTNSNCRQLVLPGVDLFKNERDFILGCKTALHLVRSVKGVKAFLQDDTLLCFAVDVFGKDFETITSCLERSLDACLLAVNLYWLERGRQEKVNKVNTFALLNSESNQ